MNGFAPSAALSSSSMCFFRRRRSVSRSCVTVMPVLRFQPVDDDVEFVFVFEAKRMHQDLVNEIRNVRAGGVEAKDRLQNLNTAATSANRHRQIQHVVHWSLGAPKIEGLSCRSLRAPPSRGVKAASGCGHRIGGSFVAAAALLGALCAASFA